MYCLQKGSFKYFDRFVFIYEVIPKIQFDLKNIVMTMSVPAVTMSVPAEGVPAEGCSSNAL